MEETILFPSPNWFQTSGFLVSCDGWIIYGGPTKSLCALEPIPSEKDGVLLGKHRFRAHVVTRAHLDRITCLALSPEWPEKREILAGSADGMVKQWTLEQIDQKWRLKPTQTHEKHYQDKEEVAGVAYSHDSYAVTVGSFGNICKWDIKSNVVKIFKHLKALKPTCISCSPHIPLNIAVGTKQGVIFVLDLTGAGKVLYKVRGQDDEITTVSWCPQYEVLVQKALGEPDRHSDMKERTEKVSIATQRMMKIRELTDEEKLALSEMGTEKKAVDESDDETKKVEVETEDVKVDSEIPEDVEKENPNVLEDSGIVKSLPEDSFDDIIVEEDDMFDIYKDHEADEFGHKKYQPEEIVIKVKDDNEPADYLTECLKLKEEILRRKNQQEPSMESLVKALDDAHIDKTEMPSTSQTQVSDETSPTETDISKRQRERVDHSVHVQKHLLASVGKYGSVRIWSKSGKLVGSCVVQSQANKNQRMKTTAWATVLWYKADTLLIGDCRSQLLECNPLKIDFKNKLGYHTLQQLHRRGLFCLATGAPRVQIPDHTYDHHYVWSAGQDRNIVCYDVAKRETVGVFATCGGFVYDIKPCPYDAGKIAVSVSDGAVRVWETDMAEDEHKLTPGSVYMHWQHVQGKVLCVAWHPSRENLLAFATGESRVGLIDTHAKSDKCARNLLSALNGGIYSLCWGEDNDLYACGGGALVVYKADKVDEAPTPINVSWEGQPWELSAVVWRPNAMLVGSLTGAVAVLTPQYPHTPLAVAFVFTKMIHTMDWHPLQTSSSSEESPLKNLIAVCSLDKANSVVILEYVENEDGTKQLNTWKTLIGHKGAVLQVCWSPHNDELLLSTSQDHTVRIWDVLSGENTHVFAGHGSNALSGAWSAYPARARAVLSGGGDACLRLWDAAHHSAAAYHEPPKEVHKKKKEKKHMKTEEAPAQDEAAVATTHSTIVKGDKKFLLPVLTKQLGLCSIQAVRKMLKVFVEKQTGVKQSEEEEDMEQSYRVNFIKIFGSIKEVNEVLDEELERHEDRGSLEAWQVLAMVRGHVDGMLQFARARDLLCPFLLSMAPCVSLKYWKDVTQLYLAQIDRLIAKGEEAKLFEPKLYGGAVYRKVCFLLSVHDVRSAVDTLLDAKLFKEAYILCRTRYMDSIAEQTLHLWSTDALKSGNLYLAAVCQIALGNIAEAANYLSKSKDESWLGLAAEMAKVAGQTTFADHVLEKREQIKNNTAPETVHEELEKLPTRLELLMKENAANDDTEYNAPKDVENEEKGQGDVMKEVSKELPTRLELLMKEYAVNDDTEDNAPKDVDNEEKGQGDVMKVESKDDVIDKNNQDENGQADMKDKTPKGDPLKEVKKDTQENDEVLNGQHEAVNGN